MPAARDEVWKEYEDAASKYFKAGKRPTIAETVAYYREQRIGLVMFTVDSEHEIGARRIPNQEVIDAARRKRHHGRVREHRSAQGQARRARGAAADRGGRHPRFQVPSDMPGLLSRTTAWRTVSTRSSRNTSAAIFHSGHSGIGTGMPGGGGIRLKYSKPMYLDDVAADFPEMKIIIAHPSWPWQDEALSVCLHKPNVYIDLSGWSPKYFPPQIVQYANRQLKRKMLFGSDFPVISPDRWIQDFKDAGFRPEMHELILKQNAIELLGLTS